MPRKPAHTHTCRRCGIAFDCSAEQERNYDGIPDVICLRFHLDDETECRDCYFTHWCDHCGQFPAIDLIDGDEVCAGCARDREAR